MRHNSHILLAKLLEKGGIRFKAQFFESVNKVPHPYRKPMFELILNAFFSIQRRERLIQVFAGALPIEKSAKIGKGVSAENS